MKKIILLFSVILFFFNGLAQTANCITIRGKANSGTFKQYLISSYNQTASDTAQPEIAAAAWTCNAQGLPTCNFRSLLRYDVSQVPANATITSAKLYLYANKNGINSNPGQPTFGSNNTALLQRVISPWPSSIGWGNIPGTTTTSQKVLPQSTNTAQDYVVDVKDFVQQWVNDPAGNNGMLLRIQTETYYNSMIFHSGNAPDSLKPRLEICYTTPPPPATCTNSLIIRGDRISGKYQQLHISTMGLNQGDTSQPEIDAAAWTCNANGFPTCNFRSIVRYDVSQVPANAIITSATLYLYAHKTAINGNTGQPTFGSNNTALLQRVITPWTAAGTGWNNQPSTTTYSQKVLPQSTSTAQNYTIDMKDFVQHWVNKPDSNYGALLRLQTEEYYNSMIFHSGNAPDSLKPRLEICYTLTVPDRCEASFTDSVTSNSFTRQFTVTTWHSNQKKPVQICWQFGDAKDTCINYNPANPYNYYGITHVYNMPGTFMVKMSVQYEGGCTDTMFRSVQVIAPPVPPACNNQLVIKGSTTNGKYKQIHLSTMALYAADTSQPEITAAAWTCNANGYPTCNFRSIMKYDVSALPANAIITGAKLYLYAKTNNINGYTGNPTFGTNNTALLQRVTTAWTVAGTGWNNQPAITTSFQKTLPQSSSTIQNYVVDVKDFVQYWVNKPDSNFGVLLRLQTEAWYNSMVFHSGQAPDSLKPRLEICYTVPNTGTDSCRAGFTDSTRDANSLERDFRAITWNSGNKKPIRICWQFGDGKDTCINYSATNNLPAYSIGHLYKNAGSYTVCVSIQYDGGCAASYCRKITVLGTPPPPDCNYTVVLRGDKTSGKFKQIHLASMALMAADTSQPEINASAWTCYAHGYPTCNFRSVFRYDVSQVPANAIITSARLFLYSKANSVNGYSGNPTYGDNNAAFLQRVITPWTMAGTGWSNQPAASSDKQKLLSQSTTARQNYTVDVTDFVQGWVKTPASNYGMLLKLQAEQYYNSMIFHSGQAPDSLKPRLEICYSLPAVADSNNVEIKLYPNPSTGPLQIWALTNNAESGDARLYDMQGNLKRILNNNIRCNTGVNLVPLQINRGGIPSGHYYVKVRIGNTTKTFKIFLL